MGDCQALKKAELMLASKRLQACSHFQEDGQTFFSALCAASMKKKVSTNKDLSLKRVPVEEILYHPVIHQLIFILEKDEQRQ